MTIRLACHSRLLNPISVRLRGDNMQMTPPRFCSVCINLSHLGFWVLFQTNRAIIAARRTIMWPLSIFLFLATAAPPQPQLSVSQDFRALQLPAMQHRQFDDSLGRKLLDENRRNTCYTIRSYF